MAQVMEVYWTFFFSNYEGFRMAMADAQTLTVPTPDEIQGDFSMSKAKIYDPTTAVANPNYDPTKPTGPTNFPYTRSQFPDNKIPMDRINPQLETFLMQYLPMPNMMMDNTGVDSNNYLDIRNEVHRHDQGTVRVDHDFSNNDLLFARYSVSAERGFSPSSGVTATTENLPGFGVNFDNLAQHAVVSWNHVFSSTKLNTVSLAFSRLAMDRTSQNDGVNDIVGQLGIQGVGFGGKGAWGAPWFAAQGYTGIGDTFAATPITATTATLNGTANPNGAATNANYQFLLGLFERGEAGARFYRKALALVPGDPPLLAIGGDDVRHLYASGQYVGSFPDPWGAGSLGHLLARRPEEVIRRAVKGMLPHNRLGTQQLRKLKIYAGSDHPHQAQRPEPLA